MRMLRSRAGVSIQDYITAGGVHATEAELQAYATADKVARGWLAMLGTVCVCAHKLHSR
jgi:hypothetical protein